MNFGKLLAYLAFGTGAIMPFADAQSPTIVQGNYITNVFGNSNFVLNPNAQTNTANVSFTSTQVLRSITTPLVATSEFNLALLQNANADWATRAFDAGMKGQNCEARFTYRGFATATTTAQIIQNSLVVAQLVLTPSTDPRIASINFPCGDLSFGTTFRIAQTTAAMTGTNEIGGIYVGLATNQANVAQAETVILATKSTTQSIPASTATTVLWNTETLDALNEYDPATGIFTAKRAGYYNYDSGVIFDLATWGAGDYGNIQAVKNTTIVEISGEYYPNRSYFMNLKISGTIYLNVGDTFKIQLFNSSAAAKPIAANEAFNFLTIKRFPSSSELVVKPETQNTYAGLKGLVSGGSNTNSVTSASWTKLTSSATLTRTPYGKAKVESNNDISITIDNMPVGSYYVTLSGYMIAKANGSGDSTACFFALADTATGGAQIAGVQQNAVGDATKTDQEINAVTLGGIYQNTSVASKTFFLQAYRAAGLGSCYGFSDANRIYTISVIPLDQPSNSALYVQGPVLGAQTGAAIPAGYLGKVEFGGGFATLAGVAGGNNTLYTISNVTPGIYLTRLYGSVQRSVAATATYYGYTCVLTTNASSVNNWYDYLNSPSNTIGSNGGSFTGFGAGGHVPSSLSTAVQIISVTATTTFYVRCSVESNNNGVNITAGAEFIRIN